MVGVRPTSKQEDKGPDVFVSAFELYRIGPGPSSSHTLGPQRAALRFVHDLAADGLLASTRRVAAELYGGLAFTGREQGADLAVVAGLAGLAPERSDRELLNRCVERAQEMGTVALGGRQVVQFTPARDLRFVVDQSVAYDGNALRFVASDARGQMVASRVYFSTGGGALLSEDDAQRAPPMPRMPFSCESGQAILDACREHGKKIPDLARTNECTLFSPGELRTGLLQVAQIMRMSLERGLTTEGTLPGGRERHAPREADALRSVETDQSRRAAIYAMAVAEENAAGGRIAAAPSSGSAGPVAALLQLWRDSGTIDQEDSSVEFLLAGAAIGGMLRIAGVRHVGCQGEVGVAAAMAAAGYASVLGGSNEQVLYAAERALAPHLGLACDPDGGRIEDPCIERNSLAAKRACEAATAAVKTPAPSNGLDLLVRTMIENGHDMSTRYKSLSVGGVAVNATEC